MSVTVDSVSIIDVKIESGHAYDDDRVSILIVEFLDATIDAVIDIDENGRIYALYRPFSSANNLSKPFRSRDSIVRCRP